MVGVVGSSPIVITTSPSLLTQGVLAQLGERDAGSVEVRGSIPLHSTIFLSFSFYKSIYR